MENKTMEITLFAKQRRTREGKTFYNFLSTLTKNNGEAVVCSVKFKDGTPEPRPEQCPMNIIVGKQDCNLSSRKYTRQVTDGDGELVTEEGLSHTLWINTWIPGAPYVDHSMDEFF